LASKAAPAQKFTQMIMSGRHDNRVRCAPTLCSTKYPHDEYGYDYHLVPRYNLSIKLRKIRLKTGFDIGHANGLAVSTAAACC
jgi:hypothetical protein